MPPHSPDLSAELDRFLRECLDSVEQCEMVMVMHHKPERWWTAPELGAELYLADVPTARDLELLAVRGLLDVRLGSDVQYRLSPASPSLTKAVTELAEYYRARRVDVLSYLVRKQGRALRHFAEAFRFRTWH